MKEPLEVLLEDSIEAATMHAQDSIQARLRGVSAMTSVEKTQPIVTDFGNFVAVEINTGDTVMISDDFSVSRLPVTVVTNGFVHELFDFPNGFAPFA